jgi:hypothetical protein
MPRTMNTKFTKNSMTSRMIKAVVITLHARLSISMLNSKQAVMTVPVGKIVPFHVGLLLDQNDDLLEKTEVPFIYEGIP